MRADRVNHPEHYTSHPSGVEAIVVCEHFCFNVGNALKYLWRADLKGNALEDLKKAAWYLAREIERRAKDPRLARPSSARQLRPVARSRVKPPSASSKRGARSRVDPPARVGPAGGSALRQARSVGS